MRGLGVAVKSEEVEVLESLRAADVYLERERDRERGRIRVEVGTTVLVEVVDSEEDEEEREGVGEGDLENSAMDGFDKGEKELFRWEEATSASRALSDLFKFLTETVRWIP